MWELGLGLDTYISLGIRIKAKPLLLQVRRVMGKNFLSIMGGGVGSD